MSEDDSMKDESKWTRADLPSGGKIREADDMAGNGLRSRVIDIALDEVVEHLNAHHPKPAHRLLSSAAECVLGAEDRVRSAKAERDAAIARAEQAENARDTATTRAEQLEKEVCKWRTSTESAHSDFLQAAHDRDEWKASATLAEQECENWRITAINRADPAVTRADIEEQLRIAYESGNHPIERIRIATDAMCNLFGIEAEPTVDPIEEKAIAAFKVAWHEADMHGDEGNRTRRGIRAARKVIEGDRK